MACPNNGSNVLHLAEGVLCDRVTLMEHRWVFNKTFAEVEAMVAGVLGFEEPCLWLRKIRRRFV